MAGVNTARLRHQASVMDSYSFNNHALLHFHEKVKDAVDPWILSAGGMESGRNI